MKPRVGGQLKWRMANQAEDLAPEISEIAGWRMRGHERGFTTRLTGLVWDQASQALETTRTTLGNAGSPLKTAPILADLTGGAGKVNGESL